MRDCRHAQDLVQGDDEVVVMLKMSFIMNCLSILMTTMTNISGMWLMLQQDKPDDFVLATGHMHSVREFVEVVLNMNMNIITIIPHICHRHHRQCLCKIILSGVKFSRLNEKNLIFYTFGGYLL